MAEATVVWDPRFLDYDFGPDHPFHESSRALAVRLLECWAESPRDPLHLDWIRAVEPAPDADLVRFHTEEYLDRVRHADREGRGRPLDRGDTPSFPGCFEAAARVAAGTLVALERSRSGPGRRAFQPGGGLHHAHPERASGFCILNDVAVGIASELHRGARRIAYLDLDVHHGDGVMYGFYRDGRVLDIDFHQSGRTLFPGTGEAYESGEGDGAGLKVNVPLPPGAGDAELGRLFRRLVPPLLRGFRPELILVQSGADGHRGDRLGSLEYTLASYRACLSECGAIATEVGARLVVTGGGGYDAGNVARTLALVGAVVAGEDDPTRLRDQLPEAWRSEFRSVTGQTAPRQLSDGAPTGRAEAAPWEDRLLTELASVLGERFPRQAAD